MFDMKNLSKLKLLDKSSPEAMKLFWQFNDDAY
jgi:hypothetical protein